MNEQANSLLRSEPPRVAFVDMDDTLLGPDKTISTDNLAALDALRGAGVRIVVASGRHHCNVKTFREIHDMEWIISSQGAIVRHAGTGEFLQERTMRPERVEEASELARKLGVTLMAYHRDGAFIERVTPWTELYASKVGWPPEICDLRDLPRDGFQKILWSDEPRRIEELHARYGGEMSQRFQVVITEPELLEFFALGASKATGAAALAERLGVDRLHTFAFGDGNNDVEILQWAGTSVAMAHGRESARHAARHVSPPGPRETAFARAVELALAELRVV